MAYNQPDQVSEEEIVDDSIYIPEELCKVWGLEYKKHGIESVLEAARCVQFVQNLEAQIKNIDRFKKEMINKADGTQQQILQSVLKVRGRIAAWARVRGEKNTLTGENEAFIPGVARVVEKGEDSVCLIFNEKNCLRSLKETGLDVDCVDQVINVYTRDKLFVDDLVKLLRKHNIEHTKSTSINRKDLCEMLKKNPACVASAKLVTEKNTCVIHYGKTKKKTRRAA